MPYKIAAPITPAVAPFSALPFVQSSPLLTPSSQTVYHPPEPAIKHVYDYQTGVWSKSDITVQLATKPFQEGTLRIIYYMKDFSAAEQNVCAKVSKEPNEPSQTYFLDVEMQAVAKKFADSFNSKNPPKTIKFLLPYVVEFKNRTTRMGKRLVVGVEPLLHGKYQKHSNNYGFVSQEDRNTPQAFSHYTYHTSGGKFLVCDIQGVEDIYTDPQIHSVSDRPRFGKADMGVEGVRKFFETHRCNAICEFLRLPVQGRKKEVGLPKQCIGKSGEDKNMIGMPSSFPMAPMVISAAPKFTKKASATTAQVAGISKVISSPIIMVT